MTKTLSGKAANNFGIASGNLISDLDAINSEVSSLGIRLVTGTFNVDLQESTQNERVNDCIYSRSSTETLYFQRCRLKIEENSRGVRCLLIRSSIHQDGLFNETLEMMSSCHLRDTYGFKTGDLVLVELSGNVDWWNYPDEKP